MLRTDIVDIEGDIVVDDDDDREVHLTVRSSHTSCQMTVDNSELRCEWVRSRESIALD
jgi:hypothetical protein